MCHLMKSLDRTFLFWTHYMAETWTLACDRQYRCRNRVNTSNFIIAVNRSSWCRCELVRHHTCSFELKMMAERQIKVIRVLPPIRGSSIRKSPSNATAYSHTQKHTMAKNGSSGRAERRETKKNVDSFRAACGINKCMAHIAKNKTETELQWESHKPWQSAKYGNNAKAIGARWSRSGNRIPNEKNSTLPYLSLAIARTEDRAFNMIGMLYSVDRAGKQFIYGLVYSCIIALAHSMCPVLSWYEIWMEEKGNKNLLLHKLCIFFMRRINVINFILITTQRPLAVADPYRSFAVVRTFSFHFFYKWHRNRKCIICA